MPVNNKSTRSSSVSACRKSQPKAAGTRVGVLSDWRHESGSSSNTAKERRSAFRDGR
ncbi:MAG TPA: hypothetical protein VFS90_10930 [Pyrinomonadaceae bacterium]|nr:hypothetical protein [Pyrinomonadaceae bacterium]